MGRIPDRNPVIVEKAVQGDEDSLQVLIERYHAVLSRRLAGQLDPQLVRYLDVEDVLQEAYAAAFQQIKGAALTSEEDFERWMERIAMNDLHDARRRLQQQKRDVRREVPGLGGDAVMRLVEQISDHDHAPGRLIDRQEAAGMLLAAMARLTLDQRTVVRLRFLEQLPAAEVAGRMDRSEAAVHALTHRALNRLRLYLGGGRRGN